jgi:hypothetical protein
MGGMADHTDFLVQDLKDGKLSEKRPAGEFSSTVFANDAISSSKRQKKKIRSFFMSLSWPPTILETRPKNIVRSITRIGLLCPKTFFHSILFRMPHKLPPDGTRAWLPGHAPRK